MEELVFYIQSIVDGTVFPEVKPDLKLRASLEAMTFSGAIFFIKKDRSRQI